MRRISVAGLLDPAIFVITISAIEDLPRSWKTQDDAALLACSMAGTRILTKRISSLCLHLLFLELLLRERASRVYQGHGLRSSERGCGQAGACCHNADKARNALVLGV